MMEEVAYCRTRLGTTFGYIYFNDILLYVWMEIPESTCDNLKDIINYAEKEQELSVKLIGRFNGWYSFFPRQI